MYVGEGGEDRQEKQLQKPPSLLVTGPGLLRWACGFSIPVPPILDTIIQLSFTKNPLEAGRTS